MPAAAQFTVSLTSVTQSTASRFSTVQLTASGFVGSVAPGAVSVTLTPTGGGATVGPMAVTSAQALFGGELMVSFVVPSTAQFITYTPSIAGQNTGGTTFTTTNPSNLILTVVEATFGLTPATAQQGQTLNVAIAGNFTHFAPGTTVATFGPGISVGGGVAGGPGPITVSTPTTAVASLTIAPGATPGTRTVQVQTGPETLALVNGFIVTTAGPTSITLNPANGSQGQTLNVEITGVNTAFAQGTTSVSFEPEITINSVVVSSATLLAANITIPNNTPLGRREM